MLSATYYIERHGPCDAGGLHHGGFPKMRTFRAPLSFRLLTFSIESSERTGVQQTTVSITRLASLPAIRRRRRSSSLTCPRWRMAVRILTPSILTATSQPATSQDCSPAEPLPWSPADAVSLCGDSIRGGPWDTQSKCGVPVRDEGRGAPDGGAGLCPSRGRVRLFRPAKTMMP